jgi:hypothetical protein
MLIDEAEEFITVGRQDPTVLPRLRRIFHRGPEMRVVLTATKRLMRLEEQPDYHTSPFLHGFIPPLYLTPLEPEEARALLARGRFSDEECQTIMDRTGCQPFLVQLIASRLFESRDLGATLDQVAADEMVANFFAVDFQTLEADERTLLEEVAREGSRTPRELAGVVNRSDETLQPLLFGLRMMGYLAPDGARLRVGNWFFERWLRRAATAAVESRKQP